MTELTLTHLYILNKRVYHDNKVNQRQESNEASNYGPHPLDPLEDIENEIVAKDDIIHVVEVDLDVEQGVCRVIH